MPPKPQTTPPAPAMRPRPLGSGWVAGPARGKLPVERAFIHGLQEWCRVSGKVACLIFFGLQDSVVFESGFACCCELWGLSVCTLKTPPGALSVQEQSRQLRDVGSMRVVHCKLTSRGTGWQASDRHKAACSPQWPYHSFFQEHLERIGLRMLIHCAGAWQNLPFEMGELKPGLFSFAFGFLKVLTAFGAAFRALGGLRGPSRETQGCPVGIV